jgi:hypothetical protein
MRTQLNRVIPCELSGPIGLTSGWRLSCGEPAGARSLVKGLVGSGGAARRRVVGKRDLRRKEGGEAVGNIPCDPKRESSQKRLIINDLRKKYDENYPLYLPL